MSEKTFINSLAIIVFILTGLVTIISFWLSYAILWEVALEGGKSGWTAFAWPLIIDFPIVVFSLFALFVIFLGYRFDPWIAHIFVLAATALTVYFNYNHAIDNDLSWQVSVTAPIMYFISFEFLARMVKIVSERSISIRTIADIRVELAELTDKFQAEQANFIRVKGQLEGQLEEIKGQIETAKGTIDSYQQDIETKKEELKRLDGGQIRVYMPDNISPIQRQQVVQKMVKDGLGNEEIADKLEVSVSTIKGDKRALKTIGVNGNTR